MPRRRHGTAGSGGRCTPSIGASGVGVPVLSEVSYHNVMGMQGITIKLPAEVLSRLREQAGRTGRSVATLVRERVEASPSQNDSVFAITSDLAGILDGGQRSATNRRRKFSRA